MNSRDMQWSECLPVELLSLWCNLEVNALLLCATHQQAGSEDNTHQHIPRSLMLKTPDTVLLVLRCLISFLSLGDAGTSEMAESTLLKSALVESWTSAAIVSVSDGTRRVLGMS